jgi:uroporphyrin-III C-methyltransferase
MAHGKVYLVGAGPGDPKLLTIKAAELIKDADVIIYDRLVGDAILTLTSEKAEKIYVGKRTGKHEIPQEKITELIIEKSWQGGKIVRLKGGDPFVFGRGGEEAEALAEKGIEFEVVPGVSSAVAAPMYAGIPLTHRDYAASVAIVTGHRGEDAKQSIDWAKITSAVDTTVILMGVESLQEITQKILEGSLNANTPAAIIESGTRDEQRTIISQLGSLAEDAEKNQVKPPAVIVIGQVVSLGRKLAWFKKPLP